MREIVFYGKWSVQVILKDAAYPERFRIAGSDDRDGIYPGSIEAPIVPVTGAQWTLTMEWLNPPTDIDTWMVNDVQRSPSYSLSDGLVIVLTSVDPVVPPRGPIYDRLVLRCVNMDPLLDPMSPFTNPFTFTLLKEEVVKSLS